jgi:hypothetical protein
MYVPQKASDDVFQQSGRLLLDQLRNHIAQHCAHSIEPLVSCTYIVQAMVIEQYLLDDKDGHGLAEFGAGLHDAETERNDFGGQQKVDHV